MSCKRIIGCAVPDFAREYLNKINKLLPLDLICGCHTKVKEHMISFTFSSILRYMFKQKSIWFVRFYRKKIMFGVNLPPLPQNIKWSAPYKTPCESIAI